MRVRDFMTPNPVSVEPATPLGRVAQLMVHHSCAAIPVIASGATVGIVTDRDITCRAVSRGGNTSELAASAVMSSPAIAVGPEDDWENTVDLMKDNHIHHLLVIDGDGHLVGIVAQSDLGRRMSNRELGALARATSVPDACGATPRPPLMKCDRVTPPAGTSTPRTARPAGEGRDS